MKHLKLLISGKVQGVRYRAAAQEKAIALGLKGFVRNEANGDVYIEAEGNPAALAAFVSWCEVGPPLAKVHTVTVTEADWRGFSDFEIKR